MGYTGIDHQVSPTRYRLLGFVFCKGSRTTAMYYKARQRRVKNQDLWQNTTPSPEKRRDRRENPVIRVEMLTESNSLSFTLALNVSNSESILGNPVI